MAPMFKKWVASWADLRSLPPEMWSLALSTLVNRMGTMAMPFLALYLTQDCKLPVTHAGAILALYGAVALCIGPIAGRLSDRWGPVRVMEITLLGAGLTVMLFAWVETMAALVVVTCLFAVASEAFRPANSAVVGTIAPGARRKSAYALHRLVLNLGMSVGPAMGGYIARYSFKPIFIINGIALLLATAILRFSSFHRLAKTHKPVFADTSTGWKARVLGAAGGDRRFLFFLLALLPVSLVFFQHQSTMPLFMTGPLGLNATHFGIVMTINTLLIITTEIPLNAMTAHWPHRQSMAVGALFFALGFGGMALVRDVWGIGLTVVVWTIGEMILFPALSAYIADISPPSKTGEYMGLYMMTFSVAFALGPLAGTQLMEAWGAHAVWMACLATGLISSLLFLRVWVPEKDAAATA